MTLKTRHPSIFKIEFHLAFLFFGLPIFPILAQSGEVTDLNALIKATEDEKTLAETYLELAASTQDASPDSAITYANTYAHLAKKTGLPNYQYHYWDVLGQILEVKGDYTVSEERYRQALATTFAKSEENIAYRLATLNRLAITLASGGKTEEAIELRESIAPQIRIIRDTSLWVKNLVNSSNLLKLVGRKNDALSQLIQARELAIAGSFPPVYRAVTSANICKLFLDADECEGGKSFCEESLELSIGLSESMRGAIVSNLAGCAVLMGKVAEAKDLVRRELPSIKNAFTRQALLKSLASAYLTEQQFDSSLVYYREVLKITHELNRRDLQVLAYRNIANAANQARRYREGKEAAAAALEILKADEQYDRSYEIALTHYLDGYLSLTNMPVALLFRDHVRLSDQFYQEDREANLTEIAEAYQNRIKQDSIANLTVRSELAEQRAKGRTWLLALAGIFLCGTIGALVYFRQLNHRLRESNRKVVSQNDQLLQARKELESQNQQISLLNQDLNHRTSNYLDSIILLLERQRDSAIANGLEVLVVNSLERQVLAFTKVQDKLGADLDTVNLKEYLEDFCATVREVLAAQGHPVFFDVNIADVAVKPAFAAPLALIINELATNSMKYAKREDGILRIALDAIEEKDGELRVFYRDGGKQEGEINQQWLSSGQGVELILGFTEELKGRVIQYGEESFAYEAIFGLAM